MSPPTPPPIPGSTSSPAAAPGSASSSSSAQPPTNETTKWKKLVRIEYTRLRTQKKFRHQDDMRKAWNSNRTGITDRAEKEEQDFVKKESDARPVW